MVEGIDSFRDKFRDYTDCYTVIGGAACDILMSEAEIAFRATKDIDMILILEDKRLNLPRHFGNIFGMEATGAGGRIRTANLF